jgi:hypothetical protein
MGYCFGPTYTLSSTVASCEWSLVRSGLLSTTRLRELNIGSITETFFALVAMAWFPQTNF